MWISTQGFSPPLPSTSLCFHFLACILGHTSVLAEGVFCDEDPEITCSIGPFPLADSGRVLLRQTGETCGSLIAFTLEETWDTFTACKLAHWVFI